MKATFYRVLKLLSGWTLIFLGVIGWFIPVVPGTIFIILGFALISAQSEWVRNLIDSLSLRFPRQAAKLRAIKEGLLSKIGGEGTP